MKKLFLLTLLVSFFVMKTEAFDTVSDTSFVKFEVNLNSPYVELYPSISPDGNTVYFTSLRWSGDYSLSGHFKINEQPQYDGDIWVAHKSNGTWGSPQLLDRHINTSLREDESTLFAGGQMVVYESWKKGWKEDGGPYYVVKLHNGEWGQPIGLGGGINEFFRNQDELRFKRFNQDMEAHFNEKDRAYLFDLMDRDFQRFKIIAEQRGFNEQQYRRFTDGSTINEEGKMLLFSANRFDDAQLHMDIYYSILDSNGNWTYPQTLLSSPYDESCPFLHDDNQTIYFASDDPKGYGGYDIYKTSILEENPLESKVNIGPKYNTNDNEFALIADAGGKSGLLVRDYNLYSVHISNDVAPHRVITVKGQVLNYKGQTLNLPVVFKDRTTGSIINSRRSDAKTGEYMFTIDDSIGAYSISAKVSESISLSREFEITDKSPDVITINLMNEFVPISGDLIYDTTIYFRHDTTYLSPASEAILLDVIQKMSLDDDYLLQIEGYTNWTPPDFYCDALSQDRARKVYDFMTFSNINGNRIEYVGLGKRNPKYKNATASGRRRNQRAELKIFKSMI